MFATTATTRIQRVLAGVALAAVLAAPAAHAMPADSGPQSSPPSIDLRSPDAREPVSSVVSRDARTPDVVDYARGVMPGDVQASPVGDTAPDGGFDTSPVLLTAAIAAGLLLLAAMGVGFLRHGRNRVPV